ncbi:uncharacterized protein [Apostichopus japonicus]|uniref:uncharacterized protein n=1 Tax=Stichopus japonicus TaxID=307972 RepID=UPI003AB79FAB
MGKEKRKRCPDFSEVETLTLVEFVATHKALLFGTGGKGCSKEEKMKERNWKKAAAVLQTVGGPVREWTMVRKKWRDLASKAKAYKAPKTGGGPPVMEDPLYEKVLGVLAKEVVCGILSEDDMASSQETICSDESEYASKPTPSVPSPVEPLQPQMSFQTRPAAVRQCQIQEELLAIQRAKLAAKKEQTIVLRSILDVLHEICKDKSACLVDMLNNMQDI